MLPFQVNFLHLLRLFSVLFLLVVGEGSPLFACLAQKVLAQVLRGNRSQVLNKQDVRADRLGRRRLVPLGLWDLLFLLVTLVNVHTLHLIFNVLHVCALN